MKMTGMNHPTEPVPPATAAEGGYDMSAMSGMEGMGTKPKMTTLDLVIVSVLSMAMLAGGFALAAHYGDLSMKRPQTHKPMSDQSMQGMEMPAN